MNPTGITDVDELIRAIRVGLQETLGEKLVGLYVFGSIATGGYEHGTSDVDLLAALSSDLSADDFARVAAVHEAVLREQSGWEDRIEIAYISTEKLRRIQAEDQIALVSPGEPVHFKEAGNDWFLNLFLLREHGLTVFGPPPHSLVDPVSAGDLTVVQRLMWEWREWITQTDLIHKRAYQGHMIITMCRNLFLWRNLRVASKREATAWAAREMPEWSALIRSALIWREGAVGEHVDQNATLPETLRFVHVVIDTILAEERTEATP